MSALLASTEDEDVKSSNAKRGIRCRRGWRGRGVVTTATTTCSHTLRWTSSLAAAATAVAAAVAAAAAARSNEHLGNQLDLLGRPGLPHRVS